MRKKFSFLYPVTHRKIDPRRKSAPHYEHVADLLINGIAYEKDHRVLDNLQAQYDITISEILYNGVNVSPLLATFDSIDNIIAACKNYIRDLFNGQQPDHNYVPVQMNLINASLAKVVSFPLKRKIN